MCQRMNRKVLRGCAETGDGIRFVASLARNQLGWIRLCMTETTRVSRRIFQGHPCSCRTTFDTVGDVRRVAGELALFR